MSKLPDELAGQPDQHGPANDTNQRILVFHNYYNHFMDSAEARKLTSATDLENAAIAFATQKCNEILGPIDTTDPRAASISAEIVRRGRAEILPQHPEL